MEILGHSDIHMTMNTYGHVVSELQVDAAARMEAARVVPGCGRSKGRDGCPAAAPLLPPAGRNGGSVIARLTSPESGGVVRLEGIEPPALRSGAARSVR